MARNRTKSAKAAGKLILEIDREIARAVEDALPNLDDLEIKVGLAHDLLQAKNANNMSEILGNKTLAQYFGELSIESNARITLAINSLRDAIEEEYV